ncbi:MAG TPA: putative quinol monooxygenase [Acidimicrobiales bacterium]|jgi:quinol monooxygenase YgiN|nr:putative quinol monooxygenase [Acidimicrobiales bacterium]
MSELTVIATGKAKPGMGDKLEQILRGCVAATHDEPGNLHYSLHRSVEDPDVVVGIERWTSQEALDAHFATPHIKTVIAETGPILSAPPEVQVFTMLPEGTSPKGRL